ncbi:MAG: replication initiation protein [Tomitella sp.]|nr:replication initiation protein [Ruaniaceae bacterium]MDN5760466.1 replication initiation protein [Tomitella sp.]
MTTASGAVLTPDEWRERYLSRFPLATDNLDMGAWREQRERALRRQYVETSPRALVAAVVIDVDRPDSVLRAFERPSDHPMPSWVVEGNQGHGHVGWWLTAPVCRTDAGKVDPLRYLARVTEGLRRSLDGDQAYTGLLTRNPLHEGADVIWGTDRTYSLGDLRTTAMPRQLPRRPERSSGLGRNVTMFDTARREVYGLHDPAMSMDEWHRVVVQRCHAVNSTFDDALGGPLPFSEVQATASSISRWVRRNFTMTKHDYQAMRGRKGAATVNAKRRNKQAARIAAIAGES